MADVQSHKNVPVTHAGGPKAFYHVIDKEGTLREYKVEDWDMAVTFTLKPKPIRPFPNGSLVLDSTDDSLFQKIGGEWYFIYLRQDDEEWTEFPTVNDRIIRESKSGNYRVLYEPEDN